MNLYFLEELMIRLRMRFTQFNISSSPVHSGQTQDACAVPAIILQRKIQTNVESFTLTSKLNAVSENLSFFCWVCVGNEVTVMHKFCRCEIRFAGTCSASFSYQLRARKLLNWFKLQGSERPDVRLTMRLTAVNFSRAFVSVWSAVKARTLRTWNSGAESKPRREGVRDCKNAAGFKK